jgi:hypothetical protein
MRPRRDACDHLRDIGIILDMKDPRLVSFRPGQPT